MLKDKVIVVTGGAGLIGQDFIRAIVEQNGRAIIADIDKDKSRRIADKLSQELKGDRVDFFELDIISEDSVGDCIEYVNRKYGRIDALINNAYPRNKNYGKHFFDVDYGDFSQNISLNLGGYFLTSQQYAKYFEEQGYGNIINISSIYGAIAPKFDIYEGTPMTVPVEYAVIKSGLIHLTKYMAKYFKGKNIRVNTLSPGGIFDAQPEQFLNSYNNNCLTKGMLDKADLNGTLLYLLSELSEYVNGQNIIVDDGFCL